MVRPWWWGQELSIINTIPMETCITLAVVIGTTIILNSVPMVTHITLVVVIGTAIIITVPMESHIPLVGTIRARVIRNVIKPSFYL